MSDLVLARNKINEFGTGNGWVLLRYGVPVWVWPTPGNPDADVPAWVVREILEAFDEQQELMDGMYDALGAGADSVMDILVEDLVEKRGG